MPASFWVFLNTPLPQVIWVTRCIGFPLRSAFFTESLCWCGTVSLALLQFTWGNSVPLWGQIMVVTLISSLQWSFEPLATHQPSKWIGQCLGEIAGLRRAGYPPTNFPSFEELACQADAGLFQAICCNPDHVLRHYFTPKQPSGHNLRPHVHIFVHPSKDPRNFVLRSLYGVPL